MITDRPIATEAKLPVGKSGLEAPSLKATVAEPPQTRAESLQQSVTLSMSSFSLLGTGLGIAGSAAVASQAALPFYDLAGAGAGGALAGFIAGGTIGAITHGVAETTGSKTAAVLTGAALGATAGLVIGTLTSGNIFSSPKQVPVSIGIGTVLGTALAAKIAHDTLKSQ